MDISKILDLLSIGMTTIQNSISNLHRGKFP